MKPSWWMDVNTNTYRYTHTHTHTVARVHTHTQIGNVKDIDVVMSMHNLIESSAIY